MQLIPLLCVFSIVIMPLLLIFYSHIYWPLACLFSILLWALLLHYFQGKGTYPANSSKGSETFEHVEDVETDDNPRQCDVIFGHNLIEGIGEYHFL